MPKIRIKKIKFWNGSFSSLILFSLLSSSALKNHSQYHYFLPPNLIILNILHLPQHQHYHPFHRHPQHHHPPPSQYHHPPPYHPPFHLLHFHPHPHPPQYHRPQQHHPQPHHSAPHHPPAILNLIILTIILRNIIIIIHYPPLSHTIWGLLLEYLLYYPAHT